jgi:hypothetical protein
MHEFFSNEGHRPQILIRKPHMQQDAFRTTLTGRTFAEYFVMFGSAIFPGLAA